MSLCVHAGGFLEPRGGLLAGEKPYVPVWHYSVYDKVLGREEIEEAVESRGNTLAGQVVQYDNS